MSNNGAIVIMDDEPEITLTPTEDEQGKDNKFFHRIVTSLGKKFFGEDDDIDNEKL